MVAPSVSACSLTICSPSLAALAGFEEEEEEPTPEEEDVGVGNEEVEEEDAIGEEIDPVDEAEDEEEDEEEEEEEEEVMRWCLDAGLGLLVVGVGVGGTLGHWLGLGLLGEYSDH